MNITFKNLKDEKPRHGSTVLYIHTSQFYNTFDFRLAEVEWMWDDDNGCSICYNGEDNVGEEFELYCMIEDSMFKMDSDYTLFWAYFDEIDELLEKEGL